MISYVTAHKPRQTDSVEEKSPAQLHRMFGPLEVGVRRELRAILPVCLSHLLGFFSFGFSAVALPDMMEEVRLLVHVIPPVKIFLGGTPPSLIFRPLN